MELRLVCRVLCFGLGLVCRGPDSTIPQYSLDPLHESSSAALVGQGSDLAIFLGVEFTIWGAATLRPKELQTIFLRVHFHKHGIIYPKALFQLLRPLRLLVACHVFAYYDPKRISRLLGNLHYTMMVTLL